MSVAADIRLVKRRVDDYLWQDNSVTLRSLRTFLESYVLNSFEAAVIGGLVRDLALKGKEGFRSDIDIVIDAPSLTISQLAELLDATPNRFGGYCFRNSRWKIDFWALENTWASREGYVSISSFSDLLRATFFDCDAILYNLNRRSVIADRHYLERLQAKTIEINLMPTPSITGNLLRAARRILFWNLQPGPKLRSFIEESLTSERFLEISAIEKSLYASCVTSRFSSAGDMRESLFDTRRRLKFSTLSAEQIRLPEL
jgi:hypothetical protein